MGAGRRRSSGARHWLIVAKRIPATRMRVVWGLRPIWLSRERERPRDGYMLQAWPARDFAEGSERAAGAASVGLQEGRGQSGSREKLQKLRLAEIISHTRLAR